MKKYLFFFCLGGLLMLNSCQKESISDKENLVSFDGNQEEGFISVEAPNGKTYKIPAPSGEEIAQSRCTGDCNSIMTFYVFPQNSQSTNVQVTINYNTCAGGQSITLSSDNSTNAPLVEDDIEMQFYNFGGSPTEFLLLVGHWDCSGGTFEFIDVCSTSSYGVYTIGETTVCNQKCHFNSFGNSFGNC